MRPVAEERMGEIPSQIQRLVRASSVMRFHFSPVIIPMAPTIKGNFNARGMKSSPV